MDKERSEFCLPDVCLSKTFSYLGVADLRSCRLACRQWYFCCKAKMITRAEKFVFRSGINPTAEINESLIDLKRHEVNVELVGIDLRELNFKLFGSKIEELELEDCILDIDTFKNLFYATPNMKRFRLSTQTVAASESCFESEAIRSVVEVWVRGMNLLHEEKFQNFNMKEFRWNAFEKRLMDILGCRLSHFLFIFPRVQSIHLWDSFTYTDIPEFRYLLPTATTITHVGGTFVLNLDAIDQSETFASFSRLKILNLNIRSFARNPSALSVCEKFFSQMAELEELTCEFLAFEEDELTVQRRGEVAKAVLFHILKSCVKLNTFSFSTSFTDPRICLNREEMGQLWASIKKIRNLRLSTMIMVESGIGEPMGFLPNTDGRLKDLEFEISCGPSDVGYRLMETHQLTALTLTIDPACFFMYFEKILQSQKCLQRLEITIIPQDLLYPSMDINWNEVIPLEHESLNHLEYVSDVYGVNWFVDHFRRIFTCDLPNLRTLKLCAAIDDSGDDNWADDYLEKGSSENDHSDAESNVFGEWLEEMRSLTQIDLKLPGDLLNFKECSQVFGKMRHLQKIVLAFPDPVLPRDVLDLFQLLPNLTSMLYIHEGDLETKACMFKYNRSKKQLFQRKGTVNKDDFCAPKNTYNLVLLN